MGGIISLLGLACCTCGMVGSCLSCMKFTGASEHHDATSVSVLTRILYSLFLVVGLILAMVLRHNGQLVDKIPMLPSYCESTAFESFCYGTYAVYRVSFVLAVFFLFHLLLSLSIVGSARVRLSLQSHGFGLKVLLFIVAVFASFFVSDTFFYAYGYVAAVGAALFLVIQVIVLLDFSFTLNSRIADRALAEESGRAPMALLVGGTVVVWLVGLGLCIASVVFFWSKLVCGLITSAVLIIGVLLGGASTQVRHGSVLTAGLVFSYTAYLAFSANSSAFLQCVKMDPTPGSSAPIAPNLPPAPAHKSEGAAGGVFQMSPTVSLVISVAIAGASLFWACVSSGGSTQSFTFEKSDARIAEESGLVDAEREEIRRRQQEAEEAERTMATSHFTFFHFVMLTASMYLAMLITSWAVGERFDQSRTGGDCIDEGRTVMWVKFATAVVTQAIYAWTLFAPVLMPDRDWGYASE